MPKEKSTKPLAELREDAERALLDEVVYRAPRAVNISALTEVARAYALVVHGDEDGPVALPARGARRPRQRRAA